MNRNFALTKRLFYPLILSLYLLAIVSCNEQLGDDFLPKEDEIGSAFLVVNLTGHTFPPNDDKCGDGISVIFELSSRLETNRVTVPIDDLTLIKVNVEEDQYLKVRVLLEDGTVLAENRAVYGNIAKPALREDQHAIYFCGNEISFNF